MDILFTKNAWADYVHWQTFDRKKLKRINLLIKETSRMPFSGTGKPEPLKWDFEGCWSRRIDQEHRLIYRVLPKQIHILSCRYHY